MKAKHWLLSTVCALLMGAAPAIADQTVAMAYVNGFACGRLDYLNAALKSQNPRKTAAENPLYCQSAPDPQFPMACVGCAFLDQKVVLMLPETAYGDENKDFLSDLRKEGVYQVKSAFYFSSGDVGTTVLYAPSSEVGKAQKVSIYEAAHILDQAAKERVSEGSD